MHSIRKALALMAVSGAALFGASGVASADGAVANGVAANSPGFLSGNLIQVPVDIPINLCGNSVNVVGALNPAFGNRCSNGEEGVEHGEQHHAWTRTARPGTSTWAARTRPGGRSSGATTMTTVADGQG